MREYQVQQIPLEQVEKNPLNPVGRGEEGDIKHLLQSIKDSGLFYPILVNRKNGGYVVVEGHRRLAVFKTLSLKNPDFATIPALVLSVGEEYLTKIFREINETSKKLTGKQWLEVYALGAEKEDLPNRLANSIVALGELFTQEELLTIARKTGPSVYGLARRVTEFVGFSPDSDSDMRQVVAWLINSGDSVNVRIAMAEGHKDRVRAAICEGRRMSGVPYPDGAIVSAHRQIEAEAA